MITRSEGRTPGVVVTAERVSARAWPASPDPTTPAGKDPLKKCEDSNAVCMSRPSGNRAAGSMLYTTASAGVTSCRKHGNESSGTRARRASMPRRWPTSNSMGWIASWKRSEPSCARVGTDRRRYGGGTFPKPTGRRGRWGFRRSGIEWSRWRPSWSWSPSSRRTFVRARMGFGRSGEPGKRWKRSERGRSAEATMWWTPISETFWKQLHTTPPFMRDSGKGLFGHLRR